MTSELDSRMERDKIQCVLMKINPFSLGVSRLVFIKEAIEGGL